MARVLSALLALFVLASPAFCQSKSKRTTRKKAAGEPGLISIVLLRTKPRNATEAEVKAAVEKAFPNAADAKRGPVVALRSGLGFITVDRVSLILHDHDKPYPDVAGGKASDRAIQKAIDAHKAWMSVDWTSDVPEDPAEAFAKIGRIVAEFIDDDTVALFIPGPRPLIAVPGKNTVKSLRSGKGLDSPKENSPKGDKPPIAEVREDDPEMKKAVAEARERFKEFADAYKDRKNTPGRKFAVKAPFKDENGTEYMWFKVSRITTKNVFGVLDNEPATVKSVKVGDKVSIPLDQLNDWLIAEPDGNIIGGFTVKVLVGRSKAKRGGRP